MKVFLDTNVIIDFFQGRENALAAGTILTLGLNGEVELFVTDLTLVNFFYICRKSSTVEQRLQFLAYLRTFVSVLPIGQDCIDKAIAMKPKDFEDCVQFHAALAGFSDFIITSNKTDFESFGAKVLAPKELLEMMNID